jgi:hypothetical protein
MTCQNLEWLQDHRTVCVTAYCQLRALVHSSLHHRRFRLRDVEHALDDLKRIFPVDLLPVLEAINHVVDELLCHFVVQPGAVIAIVDSDRVDVEVLKYRRGVGDFDSLLKLNPTNQFFTFGQLQLCVSVARFLLDDGLEVLEGGLGV